MKTIKELVSDLTTLGGAIVSSAECHEIEIANAKETARFAVVDGLGFVRRTDEWLASTMTNSPEDKALDALIVASMRGVDPEKINNAINNAE